MLKMEFFHSESNKNPEKWNVCVLRLWFAMAKLSDHHEAELSNPHETTLLFQNHQSYQAFLQELSGSGTIGRTRAAVSTVALSGNITAESVTDDSIAPVNTKLWLSGIVGGTRAVVYFL